MKKQLLTFAFLLTASLLFSQTTIDSLVLQGIQLHDNGQYEEAIKIYRSALEIDPKSPLVNYEMALTYMHMNDYENCLKHSDVVIKQNDKYLLEAYLTKGSSLDYLGKTKASIKLFKKGLKKFGDNHLLYYNLGLNYYRLKDYDNAEDALINAINTKPDHASSHLMLGYVKSNQNEKVRSILCLHYFLFLEPGTARSREAWALLQQKYYGNVEEKPGGNGDLTLYLNPESLESDFASAELIISLFGATNRTEENADKPEEELFIDNTSTLFSILGEEPEKKKAKDLWRDFYIPFFYDIAQSEHIDTYCYYISHASNAKAVEWLDNNGEKVDSFAEWLAGR